MSTLVCFHAHPDDEAIATGGTMAKAAEAGHRVVLVLATRGEHGEPVEGVLAEGEELGHRREVEAEAAAQILGAARVEFLGYRDSGMMGEQSNGRDGSFWSADVDEAAARLASILDEESADVLTVYDDHGGYGHPDHIQVHRVGTRAAELAGLDRVFWATMNRDAIRRQMEASPEMLSALEEGTEEGESSPADADDFGTPEAEITHAIDVREFIDRKRSAMVAHASQISDDSFFLKMPAEAFVEAFGTEWFVRPGRRRSGDFGTDLFADV